MPNIRNESLGHAFQSVWCKVDDVTFDDVCSCLGEGEREHSTSRLLESCNSMSCLCVYMFLAR